LQSIEPSRERIRFGGMGTPPDRDWDALAAAAAAVAVRLMDTIGAEHERLVASGLDEDAVAEILTRGATLVLAKVYHATPLHDHEGVIVALRAQLRVQTRMSYH
jgi:hypothetical protein